MRVAQKEHFHIHKVVAQQVDQDLVANEVPLKEYRSKISTIPITENEEDFIDIHDFAKTISAESLVGPYRAESTDQWTASSGITVKMSPRCDGPASWFKYEELIDDWLDLTQLDAGKRGPALKNRLAGDAAMYKGLF